MRIEQIVERTRAKAFQWCVDQGQQEADAEDMAQEAAIHRFVTKSLPSACFAGFRARRMGIVERKSRMLERTLPTEALDRLYRPEMRNDDALQYALGRLTHREQRIVIAHVVEGLTSREVGQELHLSRERVRCLLNRALAEMKRYFDLHESGSWATTTRGARFCLSPYRRTLG